MRGLKSQRRLAAQILKVGQNRVWMNPERAEDVEVAITRDEIRKLVREGVIKPLQERGVSRSRARVLHDKRRRGRRRGPGSRSGSFQARISKKEAWMSRIRALRRRLRELKNNKVITESSYRSVYRMAGSGRFESVADMERYLKAAELWRKR